MPPSLAGFDAGLCLPRDDPGWFGRSSYPPRILLLKDGAPHIVSHPSAAEPPRQSCGSLRHSGRGCCVECRNTIKFANALAAELDSAETLLMKVFQPPEVRPGRWLLSRRRMIAGDLLALTDRRVLWITDRDRGSYSRFGSIASYAPFDAVASIGVTSGQRGVRSRW
jgi:hypothetical protein